MQGQAKGSFELLMEDIQSEIEQAEGGWDIRWNGDLRVIQRESRDPSQRNNGGEYDYYKYYRADGLGVEVWEDWSCDIGRRSEYGGEETYYDCIVSPNGLKRMAQLADVTIAARAWLNKEPGCMKKLKAAIRSIEAEASN